VDCWGVDITRCSAGGLLGVGVAVEVVISSGDTVAGELPIQAPWMARSMRQDAFMGAHLGNFRRRRGRPYERRGFYIEPLSSGLTSLSGCIKSLLVCARTDRAIVKGSREDSGAARSESRRALLERGCTCQTGQGSRIGSSQACWCSPAPN
jgi:hypothetical protein